MKLQSFTIIEEDLENITVESPHDLNDDDSLILPQPQPESLKQECEYLLWESPLVPDWLFIAVSLLSPVLSPAASLSCSAGEISLVCRCADSYLCQSPCVRGMPDGLQPR